MNKKFVFLFLALVLPGLIFVFLKQCGRNEFTIPVFYQTGIDSLNAICGTHFTQPYHVPDSVLAKAGWHSGKPSLIVFRNDLINNSEFKRTSDAFDPLSYQVLQPDAGKLGNQTFERWASCVFMVKAPWNIVLLDSEKSIRGYYAIGTREETDRLIMEMQILLGQY